ncbi:MAG: Dna2/Cas4 domain-containing protein [Methanobrevibacter ruminantium]|uniref:CRISPR-associated protein Cas4 n=1 Tax=Methanobrevibacter ruminantium TaxID=83816 RepID=UPI0026F1F21C|nr:Dna2/Cas4 domain-containing protein [Methanobrevibacter ruminantium]MDD6048631.1 Dna2/Cas4 domain-containing protein [Methanobrevibacter ruminantium]
MISVSTIKSYMFCPLKLYFQSNIDEDVEEDYFISKTLKDLRIDIQDILHKNLRHIKKGMDENEIEKRLSIGISNQVKTTFEIIEEINDKEDIDESNLKKDEEIEFIDEEKKDDENDNLKELKKELVNEINLNIKILSLKVAQSMKVLDKDGHEIQNLFFPTSMYNYLIRDIGLDLIGVIDKIEVEKGNYFPISLKSSNPPINGVWDGDFAEAIANALLIEQEFNTYVTVAYVDYLKIADRRAVIIDTDARKSFFKVLTSVNKIVENREIPTVKTGLKKCENCEYKELCDNS